MRGRKATRGLAAQAVLAACMLPWAAQAQTAGTPAGDAFEQRRAQDRENLLRRQQEGTPDVHLQRPPPTAPQRLPDNETPCSRIDSIALAGADAAPFQWLLDATGGENNDDAPAGKCLGARGIEQIRQRMQDALSRVMRFKKMSNHPTSSMRLTMNNNFYASVHRRQGEAV